MDSTQPDKNLQSQEEMKRISNIKFTTKKKKEKKNESRFITKQNIVVQYGNLKITANYLLSHK